MIKKFRKIAIVAALLSSAVVAVPAAHAENSGCMLNGGCFYDSNGQSWICSDPIIYMICREMD